LQAIRTPPTVIPNTSRNDRFPITRDQLMLRRPLGVEISFVNPEGCIVVEKLRARDFWNGIEGMEGVLAFHLCTVLEPDLVGMFVRAARPLQTSVANPWWPWDKRVDKLACERMANAWRTDGAGPFAVGFQMPNLEVRPLFLRRRLFPRFTLR
jgi:hypothetical protein